MSFIKSLHIYPNTTPVCALECTAPFKELSVKEKRYAHYISKASFTGSLIVFCQTSFESPQIFIIFYRLFTCETVSSLKEKAFKLGWTEEDFLDFLTYVATFYGNCGNYKGFGDTKFIPNVSSVKLRNLLEISDAAIKYPSFMAMYEIIESILYSLDDKYLSLGLPDKAITCYFSSNVTKEDTDFVCGYFKHKGMEEWNTRLFKTVKDGEVIYTIRLASANHDEKEVSRENFNGATIVVERCDYGPILDLTIELLKQAKANVANEIQEKVLENYIKHFETGDLEYHKDASRFWIKDVGPSVESYIGFIENYRDPAGTRAEFEGFVAVVNKSTSKKFANLVQNAEKYLKRLPWDKEYEKDTFIKPDFTALDVISFASSGIPAGINIPNYDSIRQSEGFKNVALSNVMSALPKQKISFVSVDDQELFLKHFKDSFEVQVGLHELLGHGSGKLLQRNQDGTFNFDKNLKDMITGERIKSWYEPGETWSSKFGDLSNPYEECRAEAAGYYLCTYPDVMELFGFSGELSETVKYVNWMSEVRAGLLGLEVYSPDSKKWGQAHCYARYVLFNVCLQAGQDFVTVTEIIGEDGDPDLLFKLDRSKIDSVGKAAVGEFLRKLQAYKSTGDYENGSKFFTETGSITPEALRWRKIVINRRQPRRIFVQSNTEISDDGNVVLKNYPTSFEGVIHSFTERYSPETIDALENVWFRDFHSFDHNCS